MFWKKKIILDFDGTLTDTNKEAKPYLEKFIALFSEQTGYQVSRLDEQVEERRGEILKDPHRGWEVNGKIVAPAHADPYVLNYTIYMELMDKYDIDKCYNLPPTIQEKEAFLSSLFHECYPFADTVFKPGAKEFLERVSCEYDVVIVTNSKMDAVQNKLAKLGKFDIPIIGNAQKYLVDDAFVELPEFIEIQGLPRPVLLRRKAYKVVLDDLMEEGFTPENTTVIGDIFELDLALPNYLGYRTVLFNSTDDNQHHASKALKKINSSMTEIYNQIQDVFN